MIKKLNIIPTKEVLRQFASALAKSRSGEKQEEHAGVSFESIEGLRNVLTKRRLELISVIRHKKPNSIYELSKLLNRDLKSVNTDLKVLKENDFVELRKSSNGRQRVVPVVEFDKIEVMVRV
ncbi:ArsR family transcriptional regulator [Candidatus Woesearchaeota archaeon]|nr:ArsR family transcriptional regulator [Candidatus Woesearchaeota archaeon]